MENNIKYFQGMTRDQQEKTFKLFSALPNPTELMEDNASGLLNDRLSSILEGDAMPEKYAKFDIGITEWPFYSIPKWIEDEDAEIEQEQLDALFELWWNDKWNHLNGGEVVPSMSLFEKCIPYYCPSSELVRSVRKANQHSKAWEYLQAIKAGTDTEEIRKDLIAISDSSYLFEKILTEISGIGSFFMKAPRMYIDAMQNTAKMYKEANLKLLDQHEGVVKGHEAVIKAAVDAITNFLNRINSNEDTGSGEVMEEGNLSPPEVDKGSSVSNNDSRESYDDYYDFEEYYKGEEDEGPSD